MNVEIICVGTELLMGNTLNTNSQYLARQCTDLGLSMLYQCVVGDNPQRMKDTFLTAFDRSDVIITTGGLGPTQDDLTKEIIAEALGLPLVLDHGSLDAMIERMQQYGVPLSKITENNYKQAMVPEGCTVWLNPNGTAPAMLIEKDGKIVILLPGPPHEMTGIFEKYAVPYFKSLQKDKLFSMMIKMIGIGESDAADRLADLIDGTNPTLAPYAKFTEVHFRLTAKAKDEAEAETLLDPVYEEICSRLGEYIYTTDEFENIEDVIVHRMKEKGLTLAAAESCTGGLLSGTVANVPGASDVLKEGFVTYSNEAKIRSLGVKAETIERFGAVSEECAGEMAEGAVRVSGCDVGISTTGFAGPDGDDVGLVYVGLCIGGEIFVHKFHFAGKRADVRARTVAVALDMIRRKL